MNRIVGSGYREIIRLALETVPPAMLDAIGPFDVVCGVDPRFIGLHGFTHGDNGEPLDVLPHYVPPDIQNCPRDRRVSTIVLPNIPVLGAWSVVHELGHALHDALGYAVDVDVRVSWQARFNRFEAFAESFRSWCGFFDRPLVALDAKAAAFFNGLAGASPRVDVAPLFETMSAAWRKENFWR